MSPAGRRRIVVTVVLALAELVMLRPTWHSLTRTVPDNLGDPPFTLWTMDWVWHAVWHAPGSLFDAPIFFPRGNSLAWSDPLLGLAPVYGVLLWLTGNRVLAWNLTELALIALALGATYSLARRLCGRTEPAVLAALAYGFSGFTFMQLTHVQIQMAAVFPLMFLLALRMIDQPTVRRSFAFAASVLFLTLSSLYLAALAAVCLAVMVAWALIARRMWNDRRVLRALAVAAVVIAVPMALLANPYLDHRDSPDYKERFFIPEATFRPVDLLTPASGTVVWKSLDLGATEYRWERTFFPGFTTLGLAALGTVVAVRRRKGTGELWAVVVAGALSMAIAIGPEWGSVPMPMKVLRAVIPGFDDLRAPSRLAAPGLLSIAALAAVGGAWLMERWRRASIVMLIAPAVLLVELGVSLQRAELPFDRTTTAAYRALDGRPPGGVIELPMIHPDRGAEWAYGEASRMAWATIDDNPRVNGYSGSVPATYGDDLELAAGFPGNVDQLRSLGVRYVILHVGEDAGVPMLDEITASKIQFSVASIAQVDRVGDDWLIDLGPLPTSQ